MVCVNTGSGERKIVMAAAILAEKVSSAGSTQGFLLRGGRLKGNTKGERWGDARVPGQGGSDAVNSGSL